MERLTWATRLTLLRAVIVAPLIVQFVHLTADPSRARRWATLGLFALAALTDLLDGLLARRFNQGSTLGRLLDPIADKLLVLASLVFLTGWGIRLPADATPAIAGSGGGPLGSAERLPAFVLIAALSRDVTVGLGAIMMHRRTRTVKPSPRLAGKACTTFQMVTIALWFLWPDLSDGLAWAPRGSAWAAGVLGFAATMDYGVAWRRRGD